MTNLDAIDKNFSLDKNATGEPAPHHAIMEAGEVRALTPGTLNTGHSTPPLDPSSVTAPVAAMQAQGVSAQVQRWQYIPLTLQCKKQWCVAKQDKRPRIAIDELPAASATDPTTWRSFDAACSVAQRHGLYVGFMLHEEDGLTCIDLDVKHDTSQNTIDGYLSAIEYFDSFTESSCSGKGFHIWVEGKIGRGCRREGVEVYSQERFMICTGDVVRHVDISPSQEKLDDLVAGMRSEVPSLTVSLVELPQSLSDESLWAQMMSTTNGTLVSQLWKGDWKALRYPSQSEADLRLLSLLCTYSVSNEQVRRLFRHSELGKRSKATQNNSYLDRTLRVIRSRQQADSESVNHGRNIANALLTKYDSHIPATYIGTSSELRLVTASEIGARPPMNWLVRGVLPQKGIGAIFGPPGSGKSFLVIHLLGAIAGGLLWFGRRTKSVPVVYVALEGQAGLPQRIRAYESKYGTLENVHFIEQQIDLRSAESLRNLSKLVISAGLSNGILCIDTLAAGSPGLDENASADMGEVISSLKKLEEELNSLVVVVHHTGKNVDAGLRGWSGLTGAVDFSIQTSRLNNKTSDQRRRWEVSKSKDGQDGIFNSFMLEVVLVGQDDEDYPITSCVVSHAEQTNAPANERDAEADDVIFNWVEEEIKKGSHPSGRSVEAQWLQIAPQLKATQKQIRESIARLIASGRLVFDRHKGNVYLKPAVADECS